MKEKMYIVFALLVVAGIILMGAKPDGMTHFTSLFIGAQSDTPDVTPGDNDLYVKGTGEFDGDVRVDGSITVGNEVVEKTYSHASTDGALTWDVSYGNILICSGTTPSAIALPTITAAMDGYILKVKNISGATERVLTPTALVDTIESTRGTESGTTDGTADAAGDYIEWIADYRSGASGVWMQGSINIS